MTLDIMSMLQASCQSYTLTTDQLVLFAGLFVAILSIVFFISKALLRPQYTLSWGISTFNSFMMSIASFIYIIMRWDEIVQRVAKLQPMTELFHANDNFSVLICLWFALANICDMFYGYLYYKESLGFLTTWIHHPMYVYVMILAIASDKIFPLTRPFSSGFMYAFLEEIPTFALGLGVLIPSCQSDFVFGFTFVLTRIIFHACLFAYSIYSDLDIGTYIILGLSLGFHCLWYLTWLTTPKIKKDEDKKN